MKDLKSVDEKSTILMTFLAQNPSNPKTRPKPKEFFKKISDKNLKSKSEVIGRSQIQT